MGLVAPRHVGSSQTRARTRVPCIGRQILNHCATREFPPIHILKQYIIQLTVGNDGVLNKLNNWFAMWEKKKKEVRFLPHRYPK